MKLLSYKDKSAYASVGVAVGGVVAKVEGYEDVLGLLCAPGGMAAATALAASLEHETVAPTGHPRIEDLSLLSPVRRPTKVIGVGMNYRAFVTQVGEPIPEYPVLFHKTSSALTGCGQPIVIPPITDQAVPEGELAIVIGRQGSNIQESEACGYIGGYTCANDVSARNLEFRTSQWTSGKMLETFCPLGPWVVTPDEIRDPARLEVRTLLNGRLIQHGLTSDMIFGVYRLVSEISALVRLEVGDVILTGTPSDLGELTPPVFLSAGDVVRVEVEGVGCLENPVRQS